MPDTTQFNFAHKVFKAPGAVFRMDRARGQVALHVDMGGFAASVPLRSLLATFDLDEGSEDAHLLGEVERALRFVREIRPGDSIPQEIIDGSASWAIEERHQELSRSRLTTQLVRWLAGTEAAAAGVGEFDQMMQRDETRNQVNQAFAEAARHLGFGEDGREKVVQIIEQLAREMAYVEALRERLAGVMSVPRRLRSLVGAYRRERTMQETLQRTMLLLERPVGAIRQTFEMVDAQTAEIMSALRNLEATTQFIRTERDRLREQVVLWDDIIEAWKDAPVERTERTERLIRDLYRFVVTYFPIEQRWALEV